MRASLVVVPLALLGLACGGTKPLPPDAADVRTSATTDPGLFSDAIRGFRVRVPPGWRVSPRNLTPGLSDPREILAMGTGPMPPNVGGNLPTRTMTNLGSRDVILSVQERSTGSGHPDLDLPGGASDATSFPPRPDHFRLGDRPSWVQPEPGDGTRQARFWWRGFAEADRRFYVLVGVGANATPQRRRQIEAVADSLQFAAGQTWGSGPWVRVPPGWSVTMRDDAPTRRTVTLRDATVPPLAVVVHLNDPGRFAGPERSLDARVSVADLAGAPSTLPASFGRLGRGDITITPAATLPLGDLERRAATLNTVLESMRVTSR